MVIRDYLSETQSTARPSSPSPVPAYTLASPFDRFSAQVLDVFVVFIPLFSLTVAPVKRELTESSLTGDWQRVILLCGLFLLVFFLAFLFSHVMSRLFFGESFGKKVMGLKVIDLWNGEAPSLWNQTLRSVYVFFQMSLLGAPFIFVLTNRKYRGLHDQLTDTLVVNVRGEPPPVLNVWPLRWMTRFFAVACFALVLPLIFKISSSAAGLFDFQEVFDSTVEAESSTCQNTESLEEAMALVASGYMDPSCLKDSVDLEFVSGAHPSALGYLAKSFVYVDTPDLSDKYLDKVCQEESDSAACVLAQFISHWSGGEKDQVEAVLEHAKQYREPYLSLWALRYYQQMGLYRKSLEFSNGLTDDERFGIYVRAQVLKSKYFLNDIQGADRDLREMEEDSASPVVIDTMAWSCLKKISDSCEKASDSFCQEVMEAPRQENYFQPRVLLSQIRLQECADEKPKLSGYVSKGQPRAWKEFIYALDKEKRGDTKSAWSLYEDVAKMDSAPDYLKAEAIRRMSLHPDLSEIRNLENLVTSIETFEHRRESALQVLRVYQQLHLGSDIAKTLRKEFGDESFQGRQPASVKGKETP